jgi:hypothetical protein
VTRTAAEPTPGRASGPGGSGYPTAMSQTNDEQQPDPDLDQERRDIAELQDRLDDEAEGDGLAAEAGRGEENGLAEG